MFDLSDVRPLSDFKRSRTELLQHLKATRRPLLLTLNGRAEVVIQDAASYQALLEQAQERSEGPERPAHVPEGARRTRSKAR
jgi:PHD/YefM family antitoxin component YafN of YafNO toxin-antitoxin module